MRMSIFVGLILVALACATLYQTRNGFFMYVMGHATHFPPSEPSEVAAAYDALAAEASETVGVSLGDVAAARLACIERAAGAAPKGVVETALRRLNLILLGAGVNSRSPMIPPDARRVTELRPDLTRDARPWREPDLNQREQRKLDDVMEGLLDPKAAIYRGAGLAASFGHLDLRNQVETMMAGGAAFHGCVEERKFRN